MGTKTNPGKFNCYAKADPNEEMFILLGRDPCAAVTVLFWRWIRMQTGDNEQSVQLDEALKSVLLLNENAQARGKELQTVEALRCAMYNLSDFRQYLLDYSHSELRRKDA